MEPNPNPFTQSTPPASNITLTFLNPSTNQPFQLSPSSIRAPNPSNSFSFGSSTPFMSAPSKPLFLNSPASKPESASKFSENQSIGFKMGQSPIESFERDRVFHQETVKRFGENQEKAETNLKMLNKESERDEVLRKERELQSLRVQIMENERKKEEISKKVEEVKSWVQNYVEIEPEREVFGPEFKLVNDFEYSEDFLMKKLQNRRDQLEELKGKHVFELREMEEKYLKEIARLKSEKKKLEKWTESKESALKQHKKLSAFQKLKRTQKPSLDHPPTPISFPVPPPMPEPSQNPSLFLPTTKLYILSLFLGILCSLFFYS